jgi:hypothetical protein
VLAGIYQKSCKASIPGYVNHIDLCQFEMEIDATGTVVAHGFVFVLLIPGVIRLRPFLRRLVAIFSSRVRVRI